MPALETPAELTAGIFERRAQLRELLGDDEYEKRVAEAKPLVEAFVRDGEFTDFMAAVPVMLEKCPEISAVGANVILCAAVECDVPGFAEPRVGNDRRPGLLCG
jgi:hypothetical protein